MERSPEAAALCELGQWGEAEAMLLRAIENFEAGLHAPSWHPAIALAELRIRQGRLADAEALLLGKDGGIQALLPAAHLHLAQGDLELAREPAARGLRAVGDDRLRAADLLTVLVDTELVAGDLALEGAAVRRRAVAQSGCRAARPGPRRPGGGRGRRRHVSRPTELGDAGELVDAKARTAYRHRIEALRAEIEDAFDAGAEDRAEALQAELDQLVGHLAQAFGLGGRSRRASSAVERPA